MVRPAPKNIDLRKARAAVEVGAISKLIGRTLFVVKSFSSKKMLKARLSCPNTP
jgi:hypothetical protein